MKKVLLFAVMCVLCFSGAVNAQEQDADFLICERFDNYEVGDKVAEKGADYWTTWSSKEGGNEDGEVVDLNGEKCVYFTPGCDQVLRLGGYASGVYEIEFDAYVPEGKGGYYNILHDFKGGSSVWAMQNYLHLTDDGTNSRPAAGHGTVHAGGIAVADLACVYDAWMHFRIVIDINNDHAEFFCTMPGAEELSVVEWQWSKDSYDEITSPNRKLDAMNFYPPLASSAFYMDNITLKSISGETTTEITLEKEEIETGAVVNDDATVEITIENTGTSIIDYTAWIDYGVSEGGSKPTVINYDANLSDASLALGLDGLAEPTIIEIGAMYPASEYSPSVAGTKITHVSYMFLELEENGGYGIVEGSDVVFRIYGQGYNGQPGECLAEKTMPYSMIKPGEFLVAKLDEPVVLTGFNVWATVSLLQPVSTQAAPQAPLVFDGMIEAKAPYGDVIRIGNGSFYFASNLFGQSYGNTHIRITCSGNPVLAGWAKLEKVDGVIPLGESAKMKINFNTYGLVSGQTYEAKLMLAVNNIEEMFEIPMSLRVWGENVEEILSNNYNIYPNPTTSLVTIEGENINYIAVYNSVGQLIKVVKTQNNVVDMSACENGVYFFDIVDNAGQSSVQRVVVAK